MKRTTKILGQRVDTYSINQVVNLINSSVKKNNKNLFFALNINILVSLNKDPQTKELHSKLGKIIFADGVPIVWLSKFSKNPVKLRVSGTDLTELVLSNKNNKIYLLGSNTKVLTKIKSKYSSVVGYYSPPHNNNWIISERLKIIKMINNTDAKIILVALGPLKQEKWLIDNFNELNCNVGIGIGSALDILSGEKKRAPRIFLILGIEWLWRVILEPKRLIKRYIFDFIHLLKLILSYWRI